MMMPLIHGMIGSAPPPPPPVSLIQQITAAAQTPANASLPFTEQHEEGDLLVVVAMSSSSGAPRTLQTGWTTAASEVDFAVWYRTLGAGDDPTTYTFDATNNFQRLCIAGFLVRNATTVTAQSYSQNTPVSHNLAGTFSDPMLVILGAGRNNSSSGVEMPSGYGDLFVTSGTTCGLNAGSELVNGGSVPTLNVSAPTPVFDPPIQSAIVAVS